MSYPERQRQFPRRRMKGNMISTRPDYDDTDSDQAQAETQPPPSEPPGPENPFYPMPTPGEQDAPMQIIDLERDIRLFVHPDLPAGIVNIGNGQQGGYRYLDINFHPVGGGEPNLVYFIEFLQIIEMID